MKYFLFILVIFSFTFSSAFAENIIPITKSPGVESIVFDGKWTNELEWKPTGLYTLTTETDQIFLRTAHYGDFVYAMIDVVPDITPDQNDFAVICFDTKNDRSEKPDSNDFCFYSFIDEKIGQTFHGNDSDFTKIENHQDFISIGAESDHNDRYSSISHASYEFKIPTDQIGRSNIYGFHFLIHDGQTIYSWPSDSKITSPPTWGVLISPDKSLPEFNFAIVILVLSIVAVIVLTKNYSNDFSLTI